MKGVPLLTLLTLIPLAGALLVASLGSRQKRVARRLALGFSLGALCLILLLWHGFNAASGGLQFEERHAWIPVLGVEYRLGADGLGLLLLLL